MVNPNQGTVWAEARKDLSSAPSYSAQLLSQTGEVDMKAVRAEKRTAMPILNPMTGTPLTEYANSKTPSENPGWSAGVHDSENRDYVCKVCNEVLHGGDAFNKHCEIDKRGNGREMACEVDLRLSRASRGSAMVPAAVDPNAIASAVATALAPAFNALADAMISLRDRLDGGAPRKEEAEPTAKKPRKKYARSARDVSRGASPDRSAPVSGVGQPEKPMVDPSEESEEAEPSA